MPIHRELSGEQLHTPYTWEFADETARTSETITDATLEGRLAWQKSDDTIWMLVGTSPAVWGAVGSGGGGLEWTVVSTNTTAESTKGYLVNATSGNVTITLPATPESGDSVGVSDAYNKATTNVITIARNGSNIEALAEDLIVDVVGSGFVLVYVDATVGWKIVSEISGGSSGDIGEDLDMSAFLQIQDQKTQGTDGGTFTSGAWQTRDLNTVLTNTITGASLATNQITLPAGKYYVEASASSYVTRITKARLFDITGSSSLIVGLHIVINTINPDQNLSVVSGIFQISAESDIELQHRCDVTRATNGFGIAANFTTEVYSDIRIWRVGNYVA